MEGYLFLIILLAMALVIVRNVFKMIRNRKRGAIETAEDVLHDPHQEGWCPDEPDTLGDDSEDGD